MNVVSIVAEHVDGTEFKIPQGLHYDRIRNELYLADSGNGLIGILDRDGVPKFSFAPGSGRDYPVAVDADPEGNIYVLNAGGRSVEVFDYRGEPLRQITLREAAGVAPLASGMGLSPDGRLYILDGPAGRVLVYDVAGTLLSVIRGSGSTGSRIQAPYDIAFGPDGNLYITDRQGIAVQVYDRSGRYLRGWGRRDIGVQDFSLPGGIAVDDYGSVYVADPLRQEVKVYSSAGELQERFGGFGAGPGGMAYPADVAVGGDGRVYVVERVGRRVQVFARIPLGDGPEHPSKRARRGTEPGRAP